VTDLSRVTPTSFTVSARGTVDPATLMWEILDRVLFCCLYAEKIASDSSGFKARHYAVKRDDLERSTKKVKKLILKFI